MLAFRINRWLVQLRAARPAAVLVRLVILVAGLVALLLMTSRSWDALDGAIWIAIVALPLAVALPDSFGPLVFVGSMAAGWLLRGPIGVSWAVLGFALLLAVVHLGSAFGAQFPAYAVVQGRVLGRWLPAGIVAGVVTVLVAGAGGVIRGTAVEGSLTVTVAALAGTALLIWLLSRE
jgi:hypothetical protein